MRAPFSPAAVVADVIIPLAKRYNVFKIHGDNYAGDFAKEPIRDAGLQYEIWPKHKSDIYRDPMLSLLNSYQITLPRNERGVNQICSLECSTQRTGRDQITHPSHGMDDIANAIAGSAAAAYNDASVTFDTNWGNWIDDHSDAPETKQQMTEAEREAAAAREEAESNAQWRLWQYFRAIGVFPSVNRVDQLFPKKYCFDWNSMVPMTPYPPELPRLPGFPDWPSEE